MLKSQLCINKYPVFRRLRRITSSAIVRDEEELGRIQHMMDNGYVPANNYTDRKRYILPQSLLTSWRQLRSKQHDTFKDVCLIKLKSGNGGDGKISFFRASGKSVGPPDGGTGGPGGNILIQASEQYSDLKHLRHIYSAQNGKAGGSTQLTGARGENVVLNVPVGTKIYFSPPIEELRGVSLDQDFETEVDVVNNWSRFKGKTIQLKRNNFDDGKGGWIFKERDQDIWFQDPHFTSIVDKVKKFDLINRRQERNVDLFPFEGYDLDIPGEPVCLLTGGVGGLGNMHFQTATLRSPTFAKKGREGIEVTIFMELKMIADIGLVGLPNSGKSTLIRTISNARPKVGDYDFTTLVPNIATINVSADGTQLKIADIPGIIKGARNNKGMGLGFLRHIERCKGIALVISLDREDPIEDVELLLNELGKERLENKNILIIATKADVDNAEEKFKSLQKYVISRNWDIVPCSALNNDVGGVVDKMADTVGILD